MVNSKWLKATLSHLLLIIKIGVNNRIESRGEDWNDDEEKSKMFEEYSNQGKSPSNLEQLRPDLVSIVPDLFIAQCPWSSDADEPVLFCIFTKDSDIVKENSNPDRENNSLTDFDSEIP